jgi:UDP-N-acetylglucosamine diphosphorylase/glucosamine-1-phosphate N-acetyltransferase
MAKRMNICLFEDEFVYRMSPLVSLRAVYDLRCGILTLREKYVRAFPQASFFLHCRSRLAALLREKNPKLPVNQLSDEPTWFINGRVLPDEHFLKLFRNPPPEDRVFVHGAVVVAAYLRNENLELIRTAGGEPLGVDHFGDIPKDELEVSLLNFPWHLIQQNDSELRKDYSFLLKERRRPAIRGNIHRGATLLNRRNIAVGEGSEIKPGVVIDADAGPVVLGKNVTVFPQATIIGPAFIGSGSVVKVGAQIYGGTSIGPVCKVGGELEGTILHGYSNKQHGGFLGHSYLGEWVNLGADTNTSDLKNNYATVRVDLGFETVDSGSQFVGLIMGDHSKSGISTMFNTGTVVGIFCNIFGAGFPPKYIPSFSWGGAGGLETYDLQRALEVGRRVMARRGVALSGVEEQLIQTLFIQTEADRARCGIRARLEVQR